MILEAPLSHAALPGGGGSSDIVSGLGGVPATSVGDAERLGILFSTNSSSNSSSPGMSLHMVLEWNEVGRG